MLAVLILYVCLDGNCKTVTPPALQPETLVSCSILGQVHALEWLNDHPKYILQGWGCQIGQKERQS